LAREVYLCTGRNVQSVPEGVWYNGQLAARSL
jgi:hypothetical protein